MFVFLDFDGVLRRLTSVPSVFDSDCLEQFEGALRQCDEVQIVISSSWRLAMGLADLRRRFSPEIAARIVGITPQFLDYEAHVRYREICAYLKHEGQDPWVAIDDDAEQYPPSAPMLLVDPDKGFDAECSLRLVEYLRVSTQVLGGAGTTSASIAQQA